MSKYLLCIDLDGTICQRTRTPLPGIPVPVTSFKSKRIYKRPGIEDFLSKLLATGKFEIYIYTSLSLRNAQKLLQECLGDTRLKLKIISRAVTGHDISDVAWGTFSIMRRLWSYLEDYDVRNTIILGTKHIKFRDFVHNGLLVPRFDSSDPKYNVDTLDVIQPYLMKIAKRCPKDVRQFMKAFPMYFMESVAQIRSNDSDDEEEESMDGRKVMCLRNRCVGKPGTLGSAPVYEGPKMGISMGEPPSIVQEFERGRAVKDVAKVSKNRDEEDGGEGKRMEKEIEERRKAAIRRILNRRFTLERSGERLQESLRKLEARVQGEENKGHEENGKGFGTYEEVLKTGEASDEDSGDGCTKAVVIDEEDSGGETERGAGASSPTLRKWEKWIKSTTANVSAEASATDESVEGSMKRGTEEEDTGKFESATSNSGLHEVTVNMKISMDWRDVERIVTCAEVVKGKLKIERLMENMDELVKKCGMLRMEEHRTEEHKTEEHKKEGHKTEVHGTDEHGANEHGTEEMGCADSTGACESEEEEEEAEGNKEVEVSGAK